MPSKKDSKPEPADLRAPWPAVDDHKPSDRLPFRMKRGQRIRVVDTLYQFREQYVDGRVELRAEGAAPVAVSCNRLHRLFVEGHISLPLSEGFVRAKVATDLDPATVLASVSERSRTKAEKRKIYLERLRQEDRERQGLGLGLLPINGPKDGTPPQLPQSGERPANLSELITLVAAEIGDVMPPDWRTLRKQVCLVREADKVCEHLLLDGRAICVHPERLDPHVEDIISASMLDLMYQPLGITASDLQADISGRIGEFNAKNGTNLKVPSLSTIYDRIGRLDGAEVAAFTKGRHRARALYRLDGKGSSASEPLEWVEFDWKYTNTYVITEESAGSEKPQLVRPILGAFYDTHNGLVLGHILTTRPISLSLFLLALQRLIMPEAFGRGPHQIKMTTPIRGLPSTLRYDRAGELMSPKTIKAIEALGITLAGCGKKQPQAKKIESFFAGLRHFSRKLPGYCKDKVPETLRPEQCLTEAEYKIKIESFLYELNAVRRRAGREMSPKQKLAGFLTANPGWVAPQPASRRDLEIALGVREMVTVNAKGVRYKNVHWSGEWVDKIRRDTQAHRKGTVLAELIVQPHTLEYAYLVHPLTGEVGMVSCLTPKYARAVDLWQHETILKEFKENKKVFPADDEARLAIHRDLVRTAHEISARKIRGAAGNAVARLRPDIGTGGNEHPMYGSLGAAVARQDLSATNDNDPLRDNHSRQKSAKQAGTHHPNTNPITATPEQLRKQLMESGE